MTLAETTRYRTHRAKSAGDRAMTRYRTVQAMRLISFVLYCVALWRC